MLKQFEALFDSATFGRGTEIDFSASGRGRLVTRIDGKQVCAAGALGLLRQVLLLSPSRAHPAALPRCRAEGRCR